ncbi:Triacylglycerol esterase/lipase EstA, alpha/beta hydrolase fold [Amycolatopsis arida]|uniref:Triacylglycerol esterase/lipase EstA, alpha/beta hydrolase fold n=1 Tax=Amycolatopsis arida TaxID=587909 RepID=A0A1I5S569_9PSEU|nr:lipase [Amycolatopsis arida]TDX85282.1 triacylglycerol esterase/lipase EstA (alpha/beta hydrolase family) [Amycolatopsis arida]SFP65761.1 Triacylglycerol esterase/lipase EstA, alpha/beta hydrolase fold [Amycolatopsis arida]
MRPLRRIRRCRYALVALALVVSAGGVLAPGTATAAPGTATAASGPGGFNDWSCRPSAAHPNPVVLVHGTGDNQDRTWRVLGPRLVREGYCAFALTYGVVPDAPVVGEVVGGLMPLDYSARELKAFIGRVLAATGTSKVDIVGYSQGTIVPTYYAKLLGGRGTIDRYVSLAPGWNGTNVYGLADLYALLGLLGLGPVAAELFSECRACPELLTGSATLRKLHEGGIFLPEITYTNIITRYDEIVVPYTSGIGHGPNVTNIVLQDTCPEDRVNHVGIVVDPNAIAHVLRALDPANRTPVPCVAFGPVRPSR